MTNIWRWGLGGWFSDRYLEEGERLPWGYGVAWYCPWSNRAYCLPLPLNRIVGAYRAWWLSWRRPVEDDPIDAAFRYGHNLGAYERRPYDDERLVRLTLEIARLRGQEKDQ